MNSNLAIDLSYENFTKNYNIEDVCDDAKFMIKPLMDKLLQKYS